MPSDTAQTLQSPGDAAETLDRLIEEAREGEAGAFDEIVRRLEGKALSVAMHLGASRADAEDIAQESFLKLFRHLDAYRGGRRLVSYFYRIVVNQTREHYQRAVAEREALPPAGAPCREGIHGAGAHSAADADLSAADPERRAAVLQALARLSDREREVIVLRDIHGLGAWEVARILRLNPITVRRHAMQARRRLREILGGGSS